MYSCQFCLVLTELVATGDSDAWFGLARPRFPAVYTEASRDAMLDEIAALEDDLTHAKKQHNSLQPVSRLPSEIMLMAAEHLNDV